MINLKNISKYTWFSFVPFTSLAVLTISLLCLGVISPVYLCATAIMWSLVSGLGVAVGYHRVFSHKTHSLPRWKENLILSFAALAGQGSSITWTAIHRGHHHRHTDTKEDIHTPVFKGAWYAFFGWTNQITEAKNPINFKYAVDLLRKPNHVWFHHNQLRILWLTPIIVALFDWRLALMACVLPTGLSLMQDNLINVLGHKKALIGYRNFDTEDQSQNNWILGYLGWGQGWHNNHHALPANYDFGARWWEFDPCRLWKWLL